MDDENWDCDGIIDVGVVVMAHVQSPVQDDALRFLYDALNGTRNAVIPTPTFLGAYHVMTSYLNVAPETATNVLTDTIDQQSNAYYEHVHTADLRLALQTANTHDIESWDAYLLALAQRLDTDVIYSIDTELREKVDNYTVAPPLSQDKIDQYHAYLEAQSH